MSSVMQYTLMINKFFFLKRQKIRMRTRTREKNTTTVSGERYTHTSRNDLMWRKWLNMINSCSFSDYLRGIKDNRQAWCKVWYRGWRGWSPMVELLLYHSKVMRKIALRGYFKVKRDQRNIVMIRVRHKNDVNSYLVYHLLCLPSYYTLHDTFTRQ